MLCYVMLNVDMYLRISYQQFDVFSNKVKLTIMTPVVKFHCLFFLHRSYVVGTVYACSFVR